MSAATVSLLGGCPATAGDGDDHGSWWELSLSGVSSAGRSEAETALTSRLGMLSLVGRLLLEGLPAAVPSSASVTSARRRGEGGAL